jgi:hypothetical protein
VNGRIILKCIVRKEYEYVGLIQLVVIHIPYNLNTILYVHIRGVEFGRFSWCI